MISHESRSKILLCSVWGNQELLLLTMTPLMKSNKGHMDYQLNTELFEGINLMCI